MAKLINADTGNLPSGSENIQSVMYVAPGGDVWFVPERNYPAFKMGSGDGIPATVQQPGIRLSTTATTITTDDFTIVFTQSGITQMLPNLSQGKLLNIKNLSGGIITITATAIDSQTSVMLNDGESLQVQQRDNLGSYIAL
jgi:hypothetical protein